MYLYRGIRIRAERVNLQGAEPSQPARGGACLICGGLEAARVGERGSTGGEG